MKKSTIFIFSIFLFVFCSVFVLWIFFGRNVSHQKNIGELAPITNIQYGTGAHEMILYLDYNQTGSLNFLRIFTPTLETLIDSGLIRLQYRIAGEGEDSISLALYCSYSFSTFHEYNKKILATSIVSELSKSSTSLTDMASSLGVEASKFQDCLEKKYFQNSLVRDREAAKSMNIRKFPALLLDGTSIDMFTLKPDLFIKDIYSQYGYQALGVSQRIPPLGGWQREDGQSGAVDESLFYRRIR